MMNLHAKRALITGGTKGIGAAIASDLAEAGANVAVNGREADRETQSLLTRLREHGGVCDFFAGDVANPGSLESIVQQASALLGGLDIVVHSAGGPAPGTVEDIEVADWHRAFDVHLHAAFHLARLTLPVLRQNDEGVMIFLSSAAGLRGIPNAIAYGTVKGAIAQFTRMLARDVADDNIRVNCVAPGIIRTRFHANMSAEQQAHNLAARIPLHREGTTKDVAEVVRMLVTNEFMTGEIVTVDGGMTMQICR